MVWRAERPSINIHTPEWGDCRGVLLQASLRDLMGKYRGGLGEILLPVSGDPEARTMESFPRELRRGRPSSDKTCAGSRRSQRSQYSAQRVDPRQFLQGRSTVLYGDIDTASGSFEGDESHSGHNFRLL